MDFASSINDFTNADAFGSTDYFPVLNAAGTAANPSKAATTPTISSRFWRWDNLNNKHDVYKKVFDSAIQYTSDEQDSADATTILEMLKAGTATTFCGLFFDGNRS